MILRDALPADQARVLVRVAGWTNKWHAAVAHVRPTGVCWRFDTVWRTRTAGWMDAQNGDEWCYATEQEVKP